MSGTIQGGGSALARPKVNDPATTLYCADCGRQTLALTKVDECYLYFECPCGRRARFERWGPGRFKVVPIEERGPHEAR